MPEPITSPERKRLFMAFPIPATIKSTLIHLQKPMQSTDLPIKWQTGKLMHLTTAFLGEHEVTEVEKLTEVMTQALSGFPRFMLELENLGAFPSFGNPRVLWIGVQPSAALIRLQRHLADTLGKAGYPTEPREFYPHITLGRCPHDLAAPDRRRVQGLLSQPVALQGVRTWEVDRMHLYESHSDEFGLHYSPLSGVMLPA
ncbi:MAG TPA: RNA 2',3'-cyclic phosphodiesterase [Fluviicoccus sp.]|nr:RNA 2',3'-cyclic phosphodiesterase [Fluviicoccus sp.]